MVKVMKGFNPGLSQKYQTKINEIQKNKENDTIIVKFTNNEIVTFKLSDCKNAIIEYIDIVKEYQDEIAQYIRTPENKTIDIEIFNGKKETFKIDESGEYMEEIVTFLKGARYEKEYMKEDYDFGEYKIYLNEKYEINEIKGIGVGGYFLIKKKQIKFNSFIKRLHIESDEVIAFIFGIVLNITAKIIGVVPIIKIFKGLIHLGAFISYILSFFLAIRNIKRYAAYKRKIGKNTIRVEVKYITYMTKEEAERKKREREQREREEQIASWIREKEMSSLKTQTEDNWRWKTEMESARLQEEMRKEREYQSELDRLNMLRRTNQMGETDYNYWMGNLESKHRR